MKRPHQLIVPLLLPVALVSVIGLQFLVGETPPPMSAVAWAQSSPAGALDHFQCYEVKPGVFSSPTVTVTDQFGTLTETLKFPHSLCPPTNKNNEGIVDPTDHLVGYQTKTPKFIKQTNKTFVDQFGTLTLDLVRPQFLLVPSGKDGVAQQPPLDHFQCYKVKKSKGAPKFVPKTATISNQFEQSVTLTLKKPYKVCVPADKNGEDPTAPNHPTSLVCYKTKGPRLGGSTHTIDNQFGLDEVTVIHRRELCVPSPPPTTTTTTTIATTTTTIATTTTTTTSTTTTTLYGSPSRAFLLPSVTLLD
jgi:hypothetical protein